MWYHGRDGSGPHPEAVGCGSIGLATSSDGLEWRRGSQAGYPTLPMGSALRLAHGAVVL